MPIPDIVAWLESFYARHCDGDWEHQSGLAIGTIDNPGWSVKVDLEGTDLATKPFNRISAERSAEDWIECWREGTSWEGRGGTHNLHELLETFRQWADG